MINPNLIANHRVESNEVDLADVDLSILRELSGNARISNKELAKRVGIAPSTCSGRVSSLRASGVLRGFHADIDYELLGLHVSGIIEVRLAPVGRSRIKEIIARLLEVPATLSIFQVSGARDLLVHTATRDADGLSRFIEDHLSDPSIAHTQTSLVFRHHRA